VGGGDPKIQHPEITDARYSVRGISVQQKLQLKRGVKIEEAELYSTKIVRDLIHFKSREEGRTRDDTQTRRIGRIPDTTKS
jgi:hypothetical protein